MSKHSLYKYYSNQRWAEELVAGNLLFRSLSYFRNYEDNEIRGDKGEGTAVYRPEGGLVVNNLTQGISFTLLDHAFESSANLEEIFVFCLSNSFTNKLWKKFKSVVCVEIFDIRKFCWRIEAALPAKAAFPGLPERPRIGRRVSYYHETEGGNPRWALPDQNASSKSDSYAWQDEFRLVFCFTDALAFEKVDLRIVQNTTGNTPKLVRCLVPAFDGLDRV